MLEWVDAHGLLVGLLYFLYANFVGSLPSAEEVRKARPTIDDLSLLIYASLRKFADLTAANASRVFPQLRMWGGTNSKEKTIHA